jgi:hypothetical protein
LTVKLEWPEWGKVMLEWSKHTVPDVEICAFQIGDHYADLPWFKKQTQSQVSGLSNPQNDTAYHLCASLSGKSEEFKVAYKIYAICKEIEFPILRLNPIIHIFEKNDYRLNNWWHSNARNVLPHIDEPMPESVFYRLPDMPNWRDLTGYAAKTWTAIAEQWVVIRIPNFMDHRSEEFRQYTAYVDKLSLQHERKEYERLKAKFEKGDKQF